MRKDIETMMLRLLNWKNFFFLRGLFLFFLIAVAMEISAAQPAGVQKFSSLRGFTLGSKCAENYIQYRSEVSDRAIAAMLAQRKINPNAPSTAWDAVMQTYACAPNKFNSSNSEEFIHKLDKGGETIFLHYGRDAHLRMISSSVQYDGDGRIGPTEDVFFDEIGKRFGNPKLIDDIEQSPRGRAVRRINGASETIALHEEKSRYAWWSSDGAPWTGTLNIWDELNDSCIAKSDSNCASDLNNKLRIRERSLRGHVIQMRVFSRAGRVTKVFTELFDAAEEAKFRATKENQEREEEAASIPKY